MCCRYAVLRILALISTTSAIMAVRLDCPNKFLICTLYNVETNDKNEIEFPRAFDRNMAQKLTGISFKHSKFKSFPNNLFKVMPNLKSIVARDCELTELDESTFGLSSTNNVTGIKQLHLSGNLLTILEAYTFSNTENLVYLDVEHNHLSQIDANAFDGLSHLEFLILSENQLEYLNPSVFAPLLSLRHLGLRNNQIQVFNFDNIKGNRGLTINLAKNKLSKLQSSGANNVVDNIDLSDNQLVDISALTNLKGMRFLRLSNNKKVELKSNDFSKMTSLLALDLNSVNLLRQANKYNEFLNPLCNLLLLSISSNELTSLKKFPLLPKLQNLVADGNDISNLVVNDLKTKFPKLEKININNNTLDCEELKNVQNMLKKNKIKLSFGKERKVAQRQPNGTIAECDTNDKHGVR
jgi:Leucine-rich repeat (LRR) protein